MKILIFLVAVVLLLWLLRKSSTRRTTTRKPRPPREAAGTPQPMLACAQCGVHLPRDEALPGRGGVFCGEAHRADYERAHPDRP
jgi:uncharacterized protein